MSKMRQCPPGDEMQMKNIFSRRNFVCSGALVAAGCVASKEVFAVAAERALVDEGTAIRLGVASYTFRNFSRPQMIGFLKQLNVLALNHGPEDKLWHSPLDVLKAVKSMDPRIGCCIDVGHTARAGTDVVQAIHEVGARVFNLHMKDLTNFQSKESQVAVGEGIMPVKRIFEALSVIKYKGFVDLEYEVHPDDPMPGVIGSFAYMRGVLAGMGYAAQS